MFDRFLKELDEDPFFSEINEPMRQMRRSFSELMGRQPFLPRVEEGGREPPRGRIEAPHGRTESPGAVMESDRDDRRDYMNLMSMDPFGMTTGFMRAMHRGADEDDPNAHSFSSHEVMSYSKVGDGPPKVLQASSRVRRAPGGIKETRQALRDTERGLEKMSIGRHIQDRGHIVEKRENMRTGEKELNQDFRNMEESEAPSFEEEWQRRTAKFRSKPRPKSLKN